MSSVEKDPRTVDLIIYYPLPEYKEFLRTTPFTIINKIMVPDATDSKEKIIIYRLRKDDIEADTEAETDACINY